MQFAANLSLLFTELPLLERFKAAKNSGFSAVEIQFPYEETPETIQAELVNNGLKLILFNVAADDLLQGGEGLAAVPEKAQAFRQALAQTAEYINVLKPEAINVLPGCCHDVSRIDAYLTVFKINLSLAVTTFAPLGVKTVFEAINTFDMPGFIIHSGKQMLEIMAELDHPDLFMQYDIYHMQRMGENVARFIHLNGHKIGHIQFADCPGRGQPGTGEIDFNEVFSAITESGYSGWVGAEYRPTSSTFDSLDWLAHCNNF
ncbi:MAG: TIM barrel protein [Methylicorpusculum sp.]|uniref:hydroxypyruvate isomerase family protein n=1 Tax=Methylicorpusculum sp. TaxID=2713644 RepID=UPI002722FD5B|nr:TIM barrel protein [Methylicorpusculum sp.]MDO8941144.1 TIM barrel protein [Methylicorpusculum sp.]MDP2204179.1 TIM barrel protein [Methylicorpusculum sp.]